MNVEQKHVSDGSTATYYELPAGSTQLQDLISYRDMNFQIGEIFKACYRYGQAAHSEKLRDAKKIKFYAEAEIKRLQALEQKAAKSLHEIEAEWAAKVPRQDTKTPRLDMLPGLISYQGTHISNIHFFLSQRGYSTEGLVDDLNTLVNLGMVIYNPAGDVWCRCKP